ncbi:MAG: K+/H+ antiporter subunit F [Comamonas sp.]
MALGTYRLLRGPSAQDRILALDNVYISGMLLIQVFGMAFGTTSYFEAALLVAMFGFVSSMAMAKFLLRGEVIE